MRLRWQSHFLWGGARGSASGLRQGSALHPRRVFDPLDTLFAIELVASIIQFPRVYWETKNQLQYPKSRLEATGEGVKEAPADLSVFIAPLSRPQARNPAISLH